MRRRECWAIVGESEAIVVDTGFAAPAAERRRRTLLRCPTEALRGLGIEAREVRDVIITHLHYDHAGNLDKFPMATFHLQETEMVFATGACMCEPFLRHAYDVDDVVQMVRNVYAGRVRFHCGDVELRPGLSLHRIRVSIRACARSWRCTGSLPEQTAHWANHPSNKLFRDWIQSLRLRSSHAGP
jgi:ribonuclease BN (tRNA processing enzyme)